MRALAAGPLGVLVMVAPLVAIPILSTFGIPQFAPLVASPGDDEAEGDIVPGTPEEQPVELEPSRPSTTVGNRTADDLFAPLAPAPSKRNEVQLADRGSDRYSQSDSGRAETGLGDLVPPGGSTRKSKRSNSQTYGSQNQGSRTGSRSRAMSGWDEVPETESEELSEPPQPDFSGDTLQTPDTSSDTTEEPVGSSLRMPGGAPSRGSERRLPGRDQSHLEADSNMGTDSSIGADPREGTSQLELLEQSDTDELTWKGARDKLNELGIREYMVKAMSDGRFKFTCGVSDPGSPQVDRWFVTYADEPLMAIEKALRQIEEWRDSQ